MSLDFRPPSLLLPISTSVYNPAIFTSPTEHTRAALAMKVVIPTTDFHFNSSPYSTEPSTPKRFGNFYLSAPSSPTRFSDFYRDFDWKEENPSTQNQSPSSKPSCEDEFAFDFHSESEKTILPAEELFESGKIRSLKPPRSRFSASTENTQKRTEQERGRKGNPLIEKTGKRTEQERGRERNPSLASSNSARREARSQSPERVSKYPWEDEEEQETKQTKQSSNSSLFSKIGSRKWRLKDFFLFRSASEGRKYTAMLFRKQEEVKSSSFRSIEGGSKRKGQGNVSAHELHYTVNRAVSEDLKRKTFLPYKQGILGRLAFNPAVHALANGFGFSKK